MFRCLLALSAITFMTVSTNAQDPAAAPPAQDAKPATAADMSYLIGFNIGGNFNSSNIQAGDLDVDGLVAGFKAGLAGDKPKFSQEEMAAIEEGLRGLFQKRQEEAVTKAKAAGEEWLAANAKKEGVKELKGGLQYKVIKAGDGASPKQTDRVTVHYTGTLTNGDVFDSSVQRGQPAQFVVGQVIKGWQMALQEMKKGDKWMLYIPSDLAYGPQGSPPRIGPHEVLVFEVELLDVSAEAPQ